MLTAIQQTIDQLPQIRQDPALWTTFDYHAVQSEQGTSDGNRQQRLRLLIALQYNAVETDETLIRHLLRQETIACEEDDHGGYGQALELAAYLLARYRRPADIWLFARAKQANFDTYCGFSHGFFLFGGTQAALDEIANSDDELKSFVLEYLYDEDNAPRHEPSEIDEAWRSLQLQFPSDPADEDTMVWVDRAIELEAFDEGRELLRNHEQSHPETRNEQSFTWKLLGDYTRAIAAKRNMIADAHEPWDQVSGSTSLANLHVLNSQPDEAWTLIQACDPLLEEIDDWYEVGLGRSVVETAFDIVNQMDPDVADIQVAFRWACTRCEALTSRSLNLLQKATTAAQRVGDRSKADYFQELAEQEQRNIDRILKG